MEIFYIGFYNPKDKINNDRELFPAAQTKMYSIIETLEELNYKIHLISMNSTIGKNNEKSVFMSITDKVDLKFFYAFSKRNKLYQILNFVYLRMQFLKKIIGFNLILEMEEIYADVMDDEETKHKELEYAKISDAYIFSTEMLNKQVNKNKKPYVVINGTYKVEESREKLFQDEKIHVVYAGILDPRKGAGLAVEAAFFLSEKYHVHILGFGSIQDIQLIKDKILKIDSNCLAEITYEGLLSGEEFIEFIQSCDIGLCTQNPDSTFNNTSFPSKILMYLSNGLRVVSINIPAIRTSKVNSLLYYYDVQTPENIAKTIMNVDLNHEYNSRLLISKLNFEFKNELKKLLEGFDIK